MILSLLMTSIYPLSPKCQCSSAVVCLLLSHFQRIKSKSSIKANWSCSVAAALLPAQPLVQHVLVFLAWQRSTAGTWWNLKQKLLAGQLGIALQICLQLLTDSLDCNDGVREEKPFWTPDAKHRWELSSKTEFGASWVQNSVLSSCNWFCVNMLILKNPSILLGWFFKSRM